VRIVLTYHKDLGAKYVLNRYIPVLLSYTISILLVLHWYDSHQIGMHARAVRRAQDTVD
jgi:hypothetical protein